MGVGVSSICEHGHVCVICMYVCIMTYGKLNKVKSNLLCHGFVIPKAII